jgi:hypothetical protein
VRHRCARDTAVMSGVGVGGQKFEDLLLYRRDFLNPMGHDINPIVCNITLWDATLDTV